MGPSGGALQRALQHGTPRRCNTEGFPVGMHYQGLPIMGPSGGAIQRQFPYACRLVPGSEASTRYCAMITL